ncbi:hypothetical protein MHU86_15243 [Fragilaria crotonensis]|nr:hypothetical protein MHU86_15243 [Fragilaria crotonensis]
MSSSFTRHSTKAMTMTRADGFVLAIVAASVLAVVAGFTTMATRRPARQASVTKAEPQVLKDELSEVSPVDGDQTPPLSPETTTPEKEQCADPEHGSVELTDSMTTDDTTESEHDIENEEAFSKETAAIGGSVVSDVTEESSKEAVSPPEKTKLRTKFRVLLQGAPSGSPKNSKLRMKLRALVPRKKSKVIVDR